jgi:GNAT superfamily N-acetyltransferase
VNAAPHLELNPKLKDAALRDLFAAAWPQAHVPTLQRLSDHSLCWVGAFNGEQLVGFVNVAWDGEAHAFLLDPVVHPDHRRAGMGLALVERAAAACTQRGIEWLHVDYEPALASFYQRAGFHPTQAGLLQLK